MRKASRGNGQRLERYRATDFTICDQRQISYYVAPALQYETATFVSSEVNLHRIMSSGHRLFTSEYVNDIRYSVMFVKKCVSEIVNVCVRISKNTCS